MVCRTLSALLLLIMLSIATRNLLAEEPAAAAKTESVDPTGVWKWEYTLNENPAEFKLRLNWDGKELTGQYSAFNSTTDIEHATFENDEVSFVANRERDGRKLTVEFNGQVQPDQIDGTVGVDFGDGPREFDWQAKRVVETDDVVGVWKLHIETPQGVIEPQLTITADGDKLHGDYVSPFGERDAEVLALKDGELTWTIGSNDNDDFDFEVNYRGRPRGNRISGTADFDFGGKTGTMEFSGERTPPENETAPAETTEEASTAPPTAEKSE